MPSYRYKIGNIVAMSHGMGMPSISILLNEIAGIMEFVGTKDGSKIIRIGTSGGIDIDPGTMVISTKWFNGLLEEGRRTFILGKV